MRRTEESVAWDHIHSYLDRLQWESASPVQIQQRSSAGDDLDHSFEHVRHKVDGARRIAQGISSGYPLKSSSHSTLLEPVYPQDSAEYPVWDSQHPTPCKTVATTPPEYCRFSREINTGVHHERCYKTSSGRLAWACRAPDTSTEGNEYVLDDLAYASHSSFDDVMSAPSHDDEPEETFHTVQQSQEELNSCVKAIRAASPTLFYMLARSTFTSDLEERICQRLSRSTKELTPCSHHQGFCMHRYRQDSWLFDVLAVHRAELRGCHSTNAQAARICCSLYMQLREFSSCNTAKTCCDEIFVFLARHFPEVTRTSGFLNLDEETIKKLTVHNGVVSTEFEMFSAVMLWARAAKFPLHNGLEKLLHNIYYSLIPKHELVEVLNNRHAQRVTYLTRAIARSHKSRPVEQPRSRSRGTSVVLNISSLVIPQHPHGKLREKQRTFQFILHGFAWEVLAEVHSKGKLPRFFLGVYLRCLRISDSTRTSCLGMETQTLALDATFRFRLCHACSSQHGRMVLGHRTNTTKQDMMTTTKWWGQVAFLSHQDLSLLASHSDRAELTVDILQCVLRARQEN